MYLVYVSMSLCIIILYIPNTNAIHANTCWFVLVYIVIHTNMFLLIGHKLWYVLWYVLICICTAAHIINQYACNTNEIHINTQYILVWFVLSMYHWYVFNTYLLVLNTYWYVFNTYTNTFHSTYHNTFLVPIHHDHRIGCILALACIEVQYMPILTCSNH